MGWKDRAVPVSSDWKSRAETVSVSDVPEVQPMAGAFGRSTAPVQQPTNKDLENLEESVGVAGKNAANAAVLNYGPELLSSVKNLSVSSPEYIQSRDAYRKDLEQGAQKHPLAAAGGALSGGLLLGAPIGAASKAAGLLPSATRLGRIAQSAVGAGALSAVANPGSEDGKIDPVQAEQRVQNAKTGALLGGGVQALAEAPGYIKEKATELSKSFALKSVGAQKAQINKLVKSGNEDKIDELANFVLDNKLNNKKTGEILDSVKEIRSESGKNLDKIQNKILEFQTHPESDPSLVNKINENIFDPVSEKSKLLKAAEDNLKGRAGGSQALAKIQGVLEDFEQYGSQPTVKEMTTMKSDLDRLINYDKEYRDLPLVQQELKKIRSYISGKIDNTVDAAGKILGSNELESLKKSNQSYGNALRIESMARNKLAMETGNRWISPSDYGTAGLGFLAGLQKEGDAESKIKNAAYGAAGGFLLNKAGRVAGPGLLAPGLRSLSTLPVYTPSPLLTAPAVTGLLRR